MKLWGFYHFFLPAVVQCYSPKYYYPKYGSEVFDLIGDNVTTLQCSASESSTPWGFIHWRENLIYPVKVCLVSHGSVQEEVPNCSVAGESRIQLAVGDLLKGTSTDLQNIPIDVGKFNANHGYCQIIDASAMAMALRLQGKNVTERTSMIVKAKIFGSAYPSFQVDVGVVSYWKDEPGVFLAFRGERPQLHAVVCTFPGCIITHDSCNAIKTENFHIKENEAPLYEPKAGPLTEDMFSVSYFKCEDNCPTEYLAANANPSNAMDQLTEALVVTA